MLVLIYSIIVTFCIVGIIFECKNDKYLNEGFRNFSNDNNQETKPIKVLNEKQQNKQYLAYFVFIIIQYFLIVYYVVLVIPHFH